MDWKEIGEWRRRTRTQLLMRRLALRRNERQTARRIVLDVIREQFSELQTAGCLGFYWPFKAEIDLRDLVRDFLGTGLEAALPVVVGKRQPLEFWVWRPRMKLARGIWNIPVPAERNWLSPRSCLCLCWDLMVRDIGWAMAADITTARS